MTLTLYALFMLPLLFKMVLDPTGTQKGIKEWANSPWLQFMGSVLAFLFALLILSTSQVQFGLNWESVLSWLAVLSVLKGIAQLFPGVVQWKAGLLTEQRIPMFAFLGILMALGLVYIDTQLLS